MKDKLLDFLQAYERKTIPLIEIEKILPGNVDYIDFASIIKEFERMKILLPVKAHKYNNKKIPLANTYRINKSYFKKNLINAILPYESKFHPKINLKVYYSLDKKSWERDLPYIEKIDLYLKKHGLPKEEAISQQRSYEITGNEKWIDEEGGKKLLERIGLLEDLKITSEPDPLMLAINKNRICNKGKHYHLIVENKATFYALIDDIENTNFTSLVYGAGWKAVGGIAVLEKQLGLTYEENTIYYFGDLDLEGISIWHSLKVKRKIILAVDFYGALLNKPPSYGKENQYASRQAIDDFLLNFNKVSREKIVDLLNKNGYYPQEGLNKEELQTIWRKLV
ncbi:MAG: DUF2399 domain-containing protein [Tissierellia bacterium]|nr:DUF2399 domain-containing protein [Tissierellia bacterium]